MQFGSLFFSAFMATVMAQSSDDSPLTTITLAASDIIAPASQSTAIPTITKSNAPVTTITLPSSAIIPATSSEPTVVHTSTLTSTLCGSCSAATPTSSVTTIKPASTLTASYSTALKNATSSGIPLGGSDSFPVNKGTVAANGTISYSGAPDSLTAGSLALSAGLLAASYFAFVL